MIDPGHGGEEKGAVGPKGTMEKDIVLQISKKLKANLSKMGYEAYLTRSSDVTLDLEDRNSQAVSKKADLFVSVHANAAASAKQRGIETYFLNVGTDAAADKLAKRENEAVKQKKMSDVDHILSTMMQNYSAGESKVLAGKVQSSLMKKMKSYSGVKDRSVRSALFYVLVGAKCPAILVETSFISNPTEEKRLKNQKYQSDLASAIAEGVSAYVKTGAIEDAES